MQVYRGFTSSAIQNHPFRQRYELFAALGVSRSVADAICAGPQRPAGKFEFRAADDSGSAELLIYEFIGYDWWSDSGMTAKRFDEELKSLGDVKHLTVRINSPGGDVWDGMSIFNMLNSYSAPTTVVIEGIAASVASVIAMAGDTVKAAELSQMMIHDSWTVAMGNEQQLRELADVLAKIDGQIADTYAAKSGKEASVFRDLQDKDTYLTANEAKELGLVDEVISSKKTKPEGSQSPASRSTRAARQLKILAMTANAY